jgi:hypothetical protein
MSLTSLEENLLNLADTVAQVAGQLVASNNPEYKPLIQTGTALLDGINQKLNPSAPAAASQISAAASAVASGVTPVVHAVQTVGSGSATASQKASALGSLIGTIETIGGDIISLFHAPSPSAAVPPAPATVTAAPPSSS